MADEKQTVTAPKPTDKPAPDRPKQDGVPVAVLILKNNLSIDGIGRNASQSIKSSTEKNKGLYEIRFFATGDWAQHYRIVYTPAQGVPVVRMVPASWCTSEPMPL